MQKNYSSITGIFGYEINLGFVGWVFVDGSPTAEEVSYFVTNLYKTVSEEEYFVGQKMILFADNASWHKSSEKKLRRIWKGFKIAYNKPSNPTLNCIENTFSYLKRNIERHHYESKQDLVGLINKTALEMKGKTKINIKKNYLKHVSRYI